MIDFKKGVVHINLLKDFFDEESVRFVKAKQVILDVQFGNYSIEVFSNHLTNSKVLIKKKGEIEKVIVEQAVNGEEDTHFVLKHYIDLLDSFQETLQTI